MYEPLLNFKEVQQLLGTGRNTLLKLLQSGELPAIKIAGKWKIQRQDIQEFIDYNKYSS